MTATKDSEIKRKVFKGRELGRRWFGEIDFLFRVDVPSYLKPSLWH